MKNFEENLEKLNTLCEKIKERDTPLEETVNSFEEGIKLASSLEKELKKVEKRVEILINQPDIKTDEKPELGLFDNVE